MTDVRASSLSPKLQQPDCGSACAVRWPHSAPWRLRRDSSAGACVGVTSGCGFLLLYRVIVDATLSGVQLRNLEAAWGVPVLDRVGLIIEIFAQRARTREARLQARMPRALHS